MKSHDNSEAMREVPGQSPDGGEIEYAADDTQPGRAAESQAAAESGPKNPSGATPPPADSAPPDERYIRLLADFENFRKRAQRETENGRRSGIRALAVELLPALDALERGLESAQASSHTQDWLDGMTALRAMLLDALRRHGVTPMDDAGQPYSHDRHEAIAVVNNPDMPPDHVYDIVLNGYMIGDDVLRPAQVRVTQ